MRYGSISISFAMLRSSKLAAKVEVVPIKLKQYWGIVPVLRRSGIILAFASEF
jgi:hypothetical protein